MSGIFDFNLLVSCGRNLERKAEREIKKFLRKIGDEAPLTVELGFRGLFGIKTDIDTETVIKKIREVLQDNPWRFRFVLKVTPVDKIVKSDIEEIKGAIKELVKKKITSTDTFRITVRKRGTDLSSHKVIEEVASVINNKVDLTNPHKIVNIEILGDITAVSVIKEGDIISISKIKMGAL